MDHPKGISSVIEGDEQRVILHPGKREDRIHPIPAQHLDQRPAPRHSHHRVLTAVFSVIHAPVSRGTTDGGNAFRRGRPESLNTYAPRTVSAISQSTTAASAS